MQTAKFGHGIVNEGELITSQEQHRLLAKRAWMQLHKFFLTNNEIFKALRIPVPWSLEEDLEIRQMLELCMQRVQKFRSEAAMRAYIAENEAPCDIEFTKHALSLMKQPSPRRAWALDLVRSFSPATVLDIGSGCGELPMILGGEGYNVTGMTCNEEISQFLNEKAREEELPVEIINGLFEYTDFGDTKFDVVVACEIIEHVERDDLFLQKCAELANKAVIITTPVGACDGGFIGNSKWIEDGAHIRSYSREGFERLVHGVQGTELFGDIRQLFTCNNPNGDPIDCFCAALVKEGIHDHSRTPAEPGSVVQD